MPTSVTCSGPEPSISATSRHFRQRGRVRIEPPGGRHPEEIVFAIEQYRPGRMFLGSDAIHKNQRMQSGYAVRQVERRGAQIRDLDLVAETVLRFQTMYRIRSDSVVAE